MDEINSALLALRQQKVGQILLTLSLLSHSLPLTQAPPPPIRPIQIRRKMKDYSQEFPALLPTSTNFSFLQRK